MPICHHRAHLPVRLLAVVAAAGLGLAASAQPGPELNLAYSHSAANPLELAGGSAGEVTVHAFEAEWRDRRELSRSTRLAYGLGLTEFTLDRAAATPVPGRLREYRVNLGLSHPWRPGWLLLGTISPGFYGDLADDAGAAFNVPALLVARRATNADLAWTFGLRVNAFSERPVVPLVGVDWKFSPGWAFTLGYPRAGFAREVGTRTKLGLGVSVQGGAFHVGEEPRPGLRPAGRRLADTRLDYREIRVGLDLEHRLGTSLVLRLAAGAITDQKFDYHERDLVVDGGGAAFLSAGLSARF